jgi:Ni,Fe-hydrogenase I large subunit
MVAKRPWERVVFDASETTETSLLTQYYNEIIVNFQREHRRLSKEKHDLLKEKKQWKKKAKELNTWMKEDKEVLVDFYEEIIRELVQPNTTSLPKDMITSVSARDERVSLLTMSGPNDCTLDEDDYDSQDTDSSDENDEKKDDDA